MMTKVSVGNKWTWGIVFCGSINETKNITYLNDHYTVLFSLFLFKQVTGQNINHLSYKSSYLKQYSVKCQWEECGKSYCIKYTAKAEGQEFYYENYSQVKPKFFVPKKLVRLVKTCLDGTQSKVRIGNYLSSSFPIENGLK